MSNDIETNLTRCVGGIVLCGGHSKRMGRPKEWLRIDGEYLLPRIVRIVSEVAGPIVVVARPDQELPELPPDVTILHDRHPDRGPLEGLAVGLEALSHRCRAALVSPTDHPWLQSVFLRRWIELLGSQPALVPELDGHRYPFTAVYMTSVAPIVEELLVGKNRSGQALIQHCGAKIVRVEEMDFVESARQSLRNVNDESSWREYMNATDSFEARQRP
ncbi:MAG: molybdenum cofactor guanylyltransferase [Planctomycetota bacterium]